MTKISQRQAEQLSFMAKQGAAAIRILVAENSKLREKLASLEVQARIDGIKEAMDQSGATNPWGTEEARDQALRKMASNGNGLEVLERAVRMVPDLSIAKMGELIDGANKGDTRPSSVAKAELDGWVMGQ